MAKDGQLSGFNRHPCPSPTIASDDVGLGVHGRVTWRVESALRSLSASSHVVELIFAFNSQQPFFNHGHEWPQIYTGRICEKGMQDFIEKTGKEGQGRNDLGKMFIYISN